MIRKPDTGNLAYGYYTINLTGAGNIILLDTIWYYNYHFSMKVTIGRAGRIVIPKRVRDRYNMHPGVPIELENGAEGVVLKVIPQQPSLFKKEGILIHHGIDTVNLDMAEVVNRERRSRDGNIAAEEPDT